MSDTLAPAGTVAVTQVLANKPGPLTTQGTFTSTGGSLLMAVSGSARRGSIGLMSVTVSVDGKQVATTQAWTNEASSHKALIPITLELPQLAAGGHSVELAAAAGTVTDQNDFFNVTVTEYAAGTVNVTDVYGNTPGGLPLSGDTFVSNGGLVILSASGSGRSSSEDAVIGMNVLVDGRVVGTAKVYTNEGSSHKTFLPVTVGLPDLAAGAHVVVLQPLPGTITDYNDFFNVTVVEVDGSAV